MTLVHSELWAKMKEQQQIKIDVKQQQQEYQRIFTQQVIIYAWKLVSWIVVTCSWIDEISRIIRSPLHIGINPFPHGQCTYNLATSAALLEKLDLNLSSIVEVYDIHLGMWGQENVNYVF